MLLLVIVAWLLALWILAALLYRAAFAVAFFSKARRRPPLDSAEHLRFAVVIPAHDEELLIADVIRSLRATRYPQDRIEIHVVADNCTDGTADRVRELGESVQERDAPDLRGKGQALDWMLARLDLEAVDAVAFFDADNLVEPDFFTHMSGELAAGGRCLQGYYDVSNPRASALTRLVSVTHVLKNLLFNAGKRELGASVTLMGTGMVFDSGVFSQAGWEAGSIGEDLEQTLNLVDRGERLLFVWRARTRAQESTGLRQGASQRQRWATGKRDLRRRALRLLSESLRRGRFREADIAIDLCLPSYSMLANQTVILLILGLIILGTSAVPLALGCLALAYQLLEFGLGLWLMRADPSFVLSILFAPCFLVWKAAIDLLAMLGHHRGRWVRTGRRAHRK